MSLNACAPPPDATDADRRAFVELLPTIQNVVRRVCSRARLTAEDQAEFTSVVLLKLVENDYAALRAFRGASGLQTYLFSVVRRCLLDVRVKEWGKWRPSRLAQRLGPLATMLERLVIREGLPMQQAVPTLKQHPGFMVTSSDVWRMHEVLPVRAPRFRRVDLQSDLEVGGTQRADANVHVEELEHRAAHVRRALATVLASLCYDDRRLLRLRFQQNLTVGRIAEITGENPRVLYRRLPALLRTIRKALVAGRVTASDVRPLIGNAEIDLEGVFTSTQPD